MTSPRSRTILHKIGLLLRLLIGVGILAGLFYRMPINDLFAVLRNSVERWPWWVAGLAFTFAGLCTGSMRWHRILASEQFPIAYSRVFRIFFIGQFFNAFFPGACGGDVVRAFYAAQEQPERRTAAALTVLIDRGIGLLTFMLVGCVMIACRGHIFLQSQRTRLPLILMAVFLAGTLLALFVLFRRNLFEHWSLFRKLEYGTRLGPIIRKVYEIFYFYRGHHHVLYTSLGFSLLNCVFLTLACACFGQSLQLPVRLIDYFTLFPVITVFSSVPLTPGGLGIREQLFAELFKVVGAPSFQTVPLSLLLYAGGVFWSLFGALLFVCHTHRSGHTLREEILEIREEPPTPSTGEYS